MFGERNEPPRPTRGEPLIMLALAIAIATVLTAGYAAVLLLAERLQQGGP
ncbi:MAG: hypothetical protein ABIL09_10350 [Gemmatimonadota bacterium]